MNICGSCGEVVLEARVLPQSFQDVVDDPHTEVSFLYLLPCSLDIQFHSCRDEPLQAP